MTHTSVLRALGGDIQADTIGGVLAAEALLTAPERPAGNAGVAATQAHFDRRPVSIEMLGRLMLGAPNLDDETLTAADAKPALAELAAASGEGRPAVVALAGAPLDALAGLGAGVAIVAATNGGWGSGSGTDALNRIEAELSAGAGAIGALPVTDAAALEDAAALARQSGVALALDAQGATVAGIEAAIAACAAAGLGPDRVVLTRFVETVQQTQATGVAGCGIDSAKLAAVARTGAVLCFDGLGRIPSVKTVVSDHDVALAIMELAGNGHGDLVTLSCGVRNKHRLTAFGGNGLEFIQRQFTPYLGMFGADKQLVAAVTGGNAVRAYAMTKGEVA